MVQELTQVFLTIQRPLNRAVPKRPLSGKADIKPETPEIESENVRFAPGSGHSGNIEANDRLRPKADISPTLS